MSIQPQAADHRSLQPARLTIMPVFQSSPLLIKRLVSLERLENTRLLSNRQSKLCKLPAVKKDTKKKKEIHNLLRLRLVIDQRQDRIGVVSCSGSFNNLISATTSRKYIHSTYFVADDSICTHCFIFFCRFKHLLRLISRFMSPNRARALIEHLRSAGLLHSLVDQHEKAIIGY